MMSSCRTELSHTWRYTAIAACALALVACGDDHDHDDADGGTNHAHGGDGDGDHAHDADGGAEPMCGMAANCTGNELTPEVGDEVAGHMGKFTAMIHEAGAFTTGEGTQVTADWVVMIKDSDGNAVTDATVKVETFSVDCMHPGPTAPVDVTAGADGNYAITSVYAHGGPWETQLMVSSGGAMDMIHISICVPGEEHGGSHGE